MDTSGSQQQRARFLQESDFISGIIKPRMLAVSNTQKAGDIYIVNAQGIFQRLAPGTVGQTLKILSSGLPGWG